MKKMTFYTQKSNANTTFDNFDILYYVKLAYHIPIPVLL